MIIYFLQAHCRAFVINVFVKTIQTTKFSPELKVVLNELNQLICTNWILNQLGDFIQVKRNTNIIFNINCNRHISPIDLEFNLDQLLLSGYFRQFYSHFEDFSGVLLLFLRVEHSNLKIIYGKLSTLLFLPNYSTIKYDITRYLDFRH